MRVREMALSLSLLLLAASPLAVSGAIAEEGPASLPGALFVTDNPEYLKKLRRVAITSFSVEIMTYLKAGEGGDLGNLISGKPNAVSVTLKGHDEKRWGELVAAYYQQLLRQLVEAGIEVVTDDELRQHPEFQRVLEAGKPGPHEEDAKAGKGWYYPAGKQVPMLIQSEQTVFQKGLFASKTEDPYMTWGSQFSSGFTTGAAQQAEFDLAKKLNAHALKVRFTVVPTLLTTNKGFWVGSSVESQASLSLPTYVNRFVLYSPRGDQSRVTLSAPAVGRKTVGAMKEVTSGVSSTLRTANAVGGVAFGLLTGGLGGALRAGANVVKDYEVEVDPESFNLMLSEELERVSDGFVKQLKVALQE